MKRIGPRWKPVANDPREALDRAVVAVLKAWEGMVTGPPSGLHLELVKDPSFKDAMEGLKEATIKVVEREAVARMIHGDRAWGTGWPHLDATGRRSKECRNVFHPVCCPCQGRED